MKTKWLLILLIGLMGSEGFAQALDWNSVDISPERIKALGIYRLNYVIEEMDEEDSYEFVRYDEHGLVSLIGDSHMVFESYNIINNTLDDQSRLVTESTKDYKIYRNNFEHYTYDSKGRMATKEEVIFGFKEIRLLTEYVYDEKALEKELVSFNGNPSAEKIYFNNAKGQPDSAQLKRFDRYEPEAATIYRYFYSFHSNGEMASEAEVFITGDTTKIDRFNAKGQQTFEMKPTEDSNPEYGSIYLESKTSVFDKKGKLIEEIFRNENYSESDGSAWSHSVKYDKDGNPINPDSSAPVKKRKTEKIDLKNGKHMTVDFWGLDTVSKTWHIPLTKGWEKRSQRMNPSYPSSKQITLIERYNDQDQLTYKTEETSYIEEQCTTTYVYQPNSRIETSECARRDYESGAESKSIFSYYFTDRKKMTRVTLESKNFEKDDSLKLIMEQDYYNNDTGRMDSTRYVYYDHTSSRTTENNVKYSYTYDAQGRITQIETYNADPQDTILQRMDQYEYDEKGTQRKKIHYTSRDLIPKGIPTEAHLFDADGKLERIDYFNEKNEVASTLLLEYDDRGLCVKQSRTNGDWMEKEIKLEWLTR